MCVWIAEAVWTFLVSNRLHSKDIWISKVAVQRSTLGETASYEPTNLKLRPRKQAKPELDIEFRSDYKKYETGNMRNQLSSTKAEAKRLLKRIENYEDKLAARDKK